MTMRELTVALAIAVALGLGGSALAQQRAQEINPSPMPPGSRAGEAPGMIPGGRSAQDGPVPGPTTAQRPEMAPVPDRGQPGAAPGGAATGATTPGPATEGGGTRDAMPPAATTQHTEPRTGAAPVPGANSFTEGQARSRMGDAGFTDIQDLRLDDQGIWRGRALRGGQQTGVALDFQGNVVATPR